MALQPSALEPHVDGGATHGVCSSVADGVRGEDNTKAARLPRWTREEILVLIQGKRDAENRYKRGRSAASPLESVQTEPKWASVSTYCKKRGVSRGPVQCRKRWSNLSGEFKKIKEWESQIKEDADSFWVMRNDLRRERKLPSFFDKEVYDILDADFGFQSPPSALTLAPEAVDCDADEAERAVFDSGRSATAEDGLFSDLELEDSGARITPEKEVPACGGGGIAAMVSPFTKTKMTTTILETCSDRMPISASEELHQSLLRDLFTESNNQGHTQGKQPAFNPEMGTSSQDRKKRKQFATDEDDEILQNRLVDVFERNANLLTTHLETQNRNFKLDYELRKDHTDSLVAVLNKLADALGSIAEKM